MLQNIPWRTLHEQSENRWLKLIDQANLDAKEVRKKLENVHHHYDEQIKKHENELKNTQQNLHEKSVQLKVALEQISEIKQDIKMTVSENIMHKSTIMKLEENKKVKTIAAKKAIKNS